MVRIKKYFLFLLLFCFCQENLLAQNQTQRGIDSLLAILKTAKEDTSKLNTLISLAELYLDDEDIIRADELNERSHSLAATLNVRSGWASVINLQAKIELFKEKNLKAEESFKAALAIYQEIGDKKGIARCFYNISRSYVAQGKNGSEVLRLNKEALKIFEEINDRHGQMVAYFNIGRMLNEGGHYPEALKNLYTSLKLARELDDKDYIAASVQYIGSTFRLQGNYPEAFKYLTENLKIRTELKKKTGIAVALTYLALNYESQGDQDEALKTFYRCLSLIDQKTHKALTAFLFGQVGNILAKKGQYEEAMKYHLASLKNWEELGHAGVALSCAQIGELLFKQAASLNPQKAKSNYIKAIKYLNRGLAFRGYPPVSVAHSGVHETSKYNVRILSDVYTAMQDYKKALEYYRIYVFMKDSLMNNETARQLENQRTEYEVEKAVEEEKIKNATAAAEQKAELKRENELLLTGFAILAIISFFIVLLIRQRNQKKRAVDKAETGHKMAELELQSLRAQLNPHFMFNSLNAIQDLILKEDNDRSQLYLSRFSKLLRILLENADQPFVSVKQEMEFLELYLSLENLRIPDLQFSIETDPGLNVEERMIPNMMLQPYIENAIWHGLSHLPVRQAGKKVNRKLQVRIHEEENATAFEIEDNGVGRQKAAELKSLYRKGHTSKGMELLSKRFNLLSKEYGEEIHTTVTDMEDNGEATGTLVKISVPFSLSEQVKQLMHDTNHHN